MEGMVIRYNSESELPDRRLFIYFFFLPNFLFLKFQNWIFFQYQVYKWMCLVSLNIAINLLAICISSSIIYFQSCFNNKNMCYILTLWGRLLNVVRHRTFDFFFRRKGGGGVVGIFIRVIIFSACFVGNFFFNRVKMRKYNRIFSNSHKCGLEYIFHSRCWMARLFLDNYQRQSFFLKNPPPLQIKWSVPNV